MQKFKQFIIVSAVFIFGGAIAVPALVNAESGSGSGESSEGSNTESENQNESQAEQGVGVEKRSRDLAEQFKKKAKERQAEVKSTIKAKTAEAKQKSCEARKENIENRLAKKVDRAKVHKLKFDKIYTRVKTFHDEKNLNTPNYDALVAEVDAAEADTAAQILALEGLNIDIDCTDPNITEVLATYKEAVNSTKASLKNYRTAIKNLIVAVHQSAEDSNDDSTNQ